MSENARAPPYNLDELSKHMTELIGGIVLFLAYLAVLVIVFGGLVFLIYKMGGKE